MEQLLRDWILADPVSDLAGNGLWRLLGTGRNATFGSSLP